MKYYKRYYEDYFLNPKSETETLNRPSHSCLAMAVSSSSIVLVAVAWRFE